jgi:hypothetical protein
MYCHARHYGRACCLVMLVCYKRRGCLVYALTWRAKNLAINSVALGVKLELAYQNFGVTCKIELQSKTLTYTSR